MSIELEPVGVVCNLSCPYCYEHPMRDAGNFRQKTYSMEKMLAGLEKEGGYFSLFGGEPLLTDVDDLETIFKWGYDRYKMNGIQTNGVLITDRHIEMFKKYNVNVGVSLDGPDEMNDTRWAGSLEKTREATRKSFENIQKCIANGLPVALIITIHKKNGLPKYRERFKAWIKELESWGVRAARLHPLEIDHSSVGEKLALTPEQNIEFLLDMWEFEATELKNFSFDVFSDVPNMLKATDQNATCIFLSCDPYTTHAVQGIDSQGNQANCGRGNKEGINWIKARYDGYERQIALYNTPEEYGGCQGCRFFIMCKAHCPGTGQEMDWRNKTDTCLTWKVSFGIYEKLMLKQGQTPLSLHPDLKKYEDLMMDAYSRGVEIRLAEIKEHLENGTDLELTIESRRNYMVDKEKYRNAINRPHLDHIDETGVTKREYFEKYLPGVPVV